LAGLAALNNEVTRQGALIGYLDDFSIMMVITVVAIPLLLLIRSPRRTQAAGAPVEVPH
jgi:DHA2 family multidrug resistance protein